MPCYEEGVAAAVGVFFDQRAETSGDGADHAAGDGEEAGVAEVAGVVLKTFSLL